MVPERDGVYQLVSAYLFHRSIYDREEEKPMGLGGQSTTAPIAVPAKPPYPDNATNGSLDIAGEKVSTKEWRDDRGHAVHVGPTDFGDTHVHGVTGRSKQSIDKARELTKRAVEHVIERMPFSDDNVEITQPA